MSARQDRQLRAARSLLEHVADTVDTKLSVRLWDGSEVPMGQNIEPGLAVSVSGPDVVTSLVRRPTLDNVVRHYALKHIDFHGADLYTFLKTARVKGTRKKAGRISKALLVKSLLPFLFGRAKSTKVDHCYQGDETGRGREQSQNRDFIQFHYDLSNEFYALFLDPEMVYSCAYFTDWSNSLEQAQRDKLDITCRKLMLQPGERFLDIGCGWGALVCHAAKYYGVHAHGITLSERQLEFAREKIHTLGLEDRVTVELQDYADLTGAWDKIASIGMVEHVGIDNMKGYMETVSRLLPDGGMFLCHGLTRPAKSSTKRFRRMRPERRLMAKYIFPGGELDHIGHMLECMEDRRFEVHDVEGWRDHYARTCRLWCERLTANSAEAIRLVGEERYRMWTLYLAGISFAIGDGSPCIFQTVATKRTSKRLTGLPPTRAHLYRGESGERVGRAA